MRWQTRTEARSFFGLAVSAAIVITALAFAILTTTQAQLATSPWPMFHHDLGHSGRSPVDTSSNSGTEKWQFNAGAFVASSPAVGADGTIYVGSEDDYLYAINPDGSYKWAFPTGNYVDSSPAVGADGTVYVGSGDEVYAIHPNGKLKWMYTLGAYVGASSPAVGADSTIYIGSDDYSVYAINSGGGLKWSFETDNPVFSSPAVGPPAPSTSAPRTARFTRSTPAAA